MTAAAGCRFRPSSAAVSRAGFAFRAPAGFFRSGFGVGNGAVTLRYARGLALYEVHVPAEVADCILLTRSPWQRRSGACTVEVRCFGEKRRRHRVRALPYEQARALVERLLTPPQE